MWLTAMGLAVGVVMVVFLLGLIVVRGLEVFWPKRVVEFHLKEGAKTAPDGRLVFAGEIMAVRKNSMTGQEELLVHMGNKSRENPGTSYCYIDASEILRREEPADLLAAERLEFGDAFFRPVELRLSDGSRIPATDAGFRGRLAELTRGAAERRERLLDVERRQIGAINRKTEKLERRVRAVESDEALSAGERAARVAEAEREMETLRAEYEALAAQSRLLREEGERDVLIVRLPTGEEREQKVEELLRVYEPNGTGFFFRLRLFFARMVDFITEEPREANTEGGVFPALFGTFVMTVLMSLLVTPLGVVAAIYLREYAKQGFIVRVVRVSVNNLAGVPSIVFGVFGLGFFVYFVGHHVDRWFFSDSLPTPTFGTGGILWASFTLALLTLPVVIVAAEEALAAVPRGVREAALACGASKWQTIQRVVLPAAAPGVLTGVILAMARGAGEVAPLMLVGVVKLAPSLPVDLEPPFIHADRKFMHLGFHIFDAGFQSPDSEAARPMVFAATLLLITLVVVMNLAAILIRNKLRKKYAAGTF